MYFAGIWGSTKLVTIPMARNKILMRIENLEDKFFEGALPRNVNLTMIVEGMWKSSHSPDAPLGSYTLTETSITGNMPLSEMENRRLKWQTDDGLDEPKTLSYSVDGDMLYLEAMRIRTFVLQFDQ